MSNPYEAPQTPQSVGPAEEKDAPSRSGVAKLSIGSYLLALISGLFVTFGVMLVVAFSSVLVGDWASSLPRPMLAMIPVGAIGLGFLSAWQSLRQARRKVEKKSRIGRS
jgi:hypothetical protein